MGIQIRQPSNRDEEQLSLGVYNATWPDNQFSIAEVDSFKRSVRAYVDLLAWHDDVLAGSAFVAVQAQRPDVGRTDLTVLAAHRGRGVGSALYNDLSVWCSAQGVEAIEAPIAEDDKVSLAFALRRGFTEIERYSRVALDLVGHEPAPIDPPAGIEVVSWAARPDLARGIYDVAAEAYLDAPGSEEDEMEPFDDWLEHDMRGSGDLPEATFVAIAADEVVGYAKFSLTSAEPTVAHHDMTGVKRAWRGRGIAGALKRAQIAWAKEHGYERLVTGNELRNTPIRRLNERLGYRPTTGRVLMRGPLARMQ